MEKVCKNCELYIKEDKEKGYCKLAPAVIVKSNGTCRGFEI